jgi:hypothetical protein
MRSADVMDAPELARSFDAALIARHNQRHATALPIGRVQQRAIEGADAARGLMVSVGDVKRFDWHKTNQYRAR